MTHRRQEGFSAHVELYLRINGDVLPVAQVGPSSLRLREVYKSCPPCDGELTITIDDQSETQFISMPQGISPDEFRINYSRASA